MLKSFSNNDLTRICLMKRFLKVARLYTQDTANVKHLTVLSDLCQIWRSHIELPPEHAHDFGVPMVLDHHPLSFVTEKVINTPRTFSRH